MVEVPELTHGMVARQTIERYHIKFYCGKFFAFEPVHVSGNNIGYHVVDKVQLKVHIHNSYNEWRIKNPGSKDVKTSFINEVISYIERDGYITEDDVNPNLIYVNNGILDTQKMELIKSTHDLFVPIRIPVTFDINAKCPAIDAFFVDITTDKKSGICDENDVLTLYEIFGYLLEPTYFIRKGIILLGNGHNGKTTCFNLMSEFCGYDNVSRLDLYAFSDRFSIPELYNKLVNIGDDFGKDKLQGQARGLIKQLTGNVKQLMARRMRSNPFNFFSRAKMYFGCNDLPSVKLSDQAFIERWVILKLLNEYPDNKMFLQTLTTESELSGLLNRALEGIERLRQKKQFSKSESQGYKELRALFEKAHIQDSRVVRSEQLMTIPLNLGKGT
jgi:putative DNA primase/helicase